MSLQPLPLLKTYLAAGVLALSVITPSLAQAQNATPLPDYVVAQFGTPPAIPTGPLSDALQSAMRVAFIDSVNQEAWEEAQEQALEEIANSGDPRLAWLISDMLRFVSSQRLQQDFASAASKLIGKELSVGRIWGELTDHLIAWDVPAPPDYLSAKREIFTNIVPGWERIFVEGDIDWRLVSWGGVLIDDRAYDTTDALCNCIPAADNPQVTSAAEATWLAEDSIVFGIVVNGEARAYPRQIMEVREMVNDTLGGRDLGIPYCTLCGAAQAYFTDNMPLGVKRPVLRTSGLLIRSNKVMYDLETFSVFDTFLGTAVTGPLAEKGIALEQASVVTTDWASWQATHPNTTVLQERYALGRDPDFRNTRDANGPIFPVGDVDPRLDVHEDVIGVITASGQPIAFQRSTTLAALLRGEEITVEAGSRRWTPMGLIWAAIRRSGSRGRNFTPRRSFGGRNRGPPAPSRLALLHQPQARDPEASRDKRVMHQIDGEGDISEPSQPLAQPFELLL